MLKVLVSGRFKRDYKRAVSRGLEVAALDEVVGLLREGKKLPPKYQDHKLTNDRRYKGVRECHIQPDWLLIYQVVQEELILYLFRTGTHSGLFGK